MIYCRPKLGLCILRLGDIHGQKRWLRLVRLCESVRADRGSPPDGGYNALFHVQRYGVM